MGRGGVGTQTGARCGARRRPQPHPARAVRRCGAAAAQPGRRRRRPAPRTAAALLLMSRRDAAGRAQTTPRLKRRRWPGSVECKSCLVRCAVFFAWVVSTDSPPRHSPTTVFLRIELGCSSQTFSSTAYANNVLLISAVGSRARSRITDQRSVLELKRQVSRSP